MSRSCVLVDGAYLQKVLERDFAKPKIDFARLGPALAAGYEPLLRTYYYNCTPYQSASPTQRESELVANADRFYYRLRQIPNFEVRLGRLEFRGTSSTGQMIFEQKRVDVQLAVDLMTLSFTHQIATAIIVAGDSDFIPAIRAAKDQAVRIVVYHGIKNAAHRDLVECADERRPMTQDFINSIRHL